jgi:hypothetical protein
LLVTLVLAQLTRLEISPARADRCDLGKEAPMNDERVVRILEEMRDLQRQHLVNYQDALRNQQESIRLQQLGLRRVRVVLALATGALVLAVGMLVMIVLRVVARLQ